MNVFVYALRDRIADSFRSLSLNEADEVEQRNLAFAVNNDPHLMFMSKDLELCRVGEMDTKSGVLTPCVPIQVVCRADQLIQKESKE